MSQQPARPLRFELPANLNPIYANAFIVRQTHSEIVLDVIQVLPADPRARVQTRLVLTPANAKLLLKALQDNLAKYEEKHGEITTPPPPLTLADQLFAPFKPVNDEGGETEAASDDET